MHRDAVTVCPGVVDHTEPHLRVERPATVARLVDGLAWTDDPHVVGRAVQAAQIVRISPQRRNRAPPSYIAAAAVPSAAPFRNVRRLDSVPKPGTSAATS